MTAVVLGLGGKLRAGKDAVADHLVAKHGFVKIGMSDALHEAMMKIDPVIGIESLPIGQWNAVPLRYTEIVRRVGYVEAKKRPEVRRLLQQLGTEVGRDMIGENTWVNVTARKVDDYLYTDTPVVVTGCRFANELSMIHQFAGRTLWVERPSSPEAPESVTAHASENSVTAADFDYTILNDGSLEDLYRRVDSML